jgi:hypothetical protein
MDIAAWILIVQVWTDPPPKISIVYTKPYTSYEQCMEARKEWIEKKLVALCSPKANSQ